MNYSFLEQILEGLCLLPEQHLQARAGAAALSDDQIQVIQQFARLFNGVCNGLY